MTGIGKATNQPSNKTFLRPKRSARRPATKFMAPLTKPKATTKATKSMKEPRGTPNSVSANAGTTVRIMPSVMPTSSTCNKCSKTWRKLTRMPYFMGIGFYGR